MIDRGFGRVNGISQHGNDAKKSTRHGVGGGESGLAINQENQVINGANCLLIQGDRFLIFNF